jgi:hypothetical protein
MFRCTVMFKYDLVRDSIQSLDEELHRELYMLIYSSRYLHSIHPSPQNKVHNTVVLPAIQPE